MNYGTGPLYPKPSIAAGGAVVAGQRLSVSSSAVQFSTAFNVNTTLVAADIQGDDVWVTYDGSTPSSSNGHRMYAGQNVLWARATATAAKFIRVTTDAKIQASEFQV